MLEVTSWFEGGEGSFPRNYLVMGEDPAASDPPSYCYGGNSSSMKVCQNYISACREGHACMHCIPKQPLYQLLVFPSKL